MADVFDDDVSVRLENSRELYGELVVTIVKELVVVDALAIAG